MTENKKNMYYAEGFPKSKSLQMKEWAIKKVKAGVSPNKIASEIKRLFKEDVTMMTIYRWKRRYIEVTGEHIPSWKELNPSMEQRNKNSKQKEKKVK